MGMFSWFTRWARRPATFSTPESTRFYSLAMALESGLLTAGTATREAALGVPAVLRGRNMICNISTLPLHQLDPFRKIVRDPLFDQIDPEVPNVVTLAMTVEDLLCDGIGWWEVTERQWNRFPKHARHVDSRRVTITPPEGYTNALPSGFDPRSVIYVDGFPRDGRQFIRFDSPNPPLLVAARRAITRAVLLEDAAAMYAEDPRPFDYFTPSDNAAGLDETTVKANIQAWIASRRKRATGFVPETMQYNTVQAPNPADLQLVQLQARASLDIANAIGVDPEDLGISTTSRTYQNATDRRQDRVNDVLSTYMRAITDRLSMGDVTRQGYRAVFVLDDYMRADPTTRWATYKTAKELGVIDAQEIREAEDLPGTVPAPKPAPVPPAAPPAVPAPADPMPAENSRQGALHMFAGAPSSATLRFDTDLTTFKADAQSRTITGTVLIYDVVADNGDGRFRFRKGSLTWQKSAVSRVKLLRDHDWGQLLGAATAIRDDGARVTASFKVARGPAGDQALAEAEDGALDGLSVGLDITDYDAADDGVYDVNLATMHETSLTPRPAFDDARLISVAASNTRGTTMPEDNTPDTGPVIDYAALAAAMAANTEFANLLTRAAPAPAAPAPAAPDQEAPMVVNPAARALPGESFARVNGVREAPAYRFDRAGRFTRGEHDFSTDLVSMVKAGDTEGTQTDFGRRVMAHIAQNFEVDTADVNELNPAINRPDMYYEAPGTRTPIWDMINKGAPPNGVQPFTLPKFSSASGLVDDHTEGTEPTTGTFVTTSQTITPTPLSGKVSITREVWDMGGNPATSNLIWNRMRREWREGQEAAAAAFLETLTAATDIALGVAPTDAALAAALKAMVVSLNFLPGYAWNAFAMEEQLYTDASNAVADDGRPFFPVIGPTNADGQASSLWQSLNIGGLVGTPAPDLTATAGALNSSWLFDRDVVHGYATAPQRLEFAGTAADASYAPVAMIDLAIWGYKAFANIDIAGVRQVTYDNAA
jgi:HK97 family phage prohead protease